MENWLTIAGWVLGVGLGLVLLFLLGVYVIGAPFIYGIGKFFMRIIYRVNVHGLQRLPEDRGVLLIPNHVSYIDAIILQLVCPRPIRFLVFKSIYEKALLKRIFRSIGAIPIASGRAKDALVAASKLLQENQVVCIFPEGELTRSGTLLKIRRGFEIIARKAGAPVVPVWLDQLWGSVFSYEGGKAFWKWPKKIPYRATVAFGEVLSAEEAKDETIREKLLELGEFCYQQRPVLNMHLAEACIRGLKRNQGGVAVVDGMDHSELKRGNLLTAAIVLSLHLKRTCQNKRIAVVLPPGKGAIIANLAILLAGKVPTNMNFTAGQAALKAAIARGEIRVAITARKMQERLENFPWPEELIHLELLVPKLKPKMLPWRLAVLLLPSFFILKMLNIPKTGDHDEAVLLFTSGSSGEPKGVVLSHRNVLGNVSQFAVMINLNKNDCILACLPFFHSFGCTVTLWYPMIEGIRIVTYPNPLDTVANAELINRYRVTMLLATPTFLRGYLKRATREQLASLRLVITGAEKLPRELADNFEEKFGHPVMEGYGLTETSPVVSVNLPDPVAANGSPVQKSSLPGSVGKLAGGIAAQIRHPDTGENLGLYQTGMLWLRGPNIFEGYLGQPGKTAEVIRGGWFKTGDLARFDEDGFLFIEGRISRFSKIGGEMVPHETVEYHIHHILQINIEEERVIAITGVPDDAKGEALVMLSSVHIEITILRTELLKAGLPSLFIPKQIKQVDKIPILGSGKLDLAAIKELASADS